MAQYIEVKEVLKLFNDLVNECADKDEFYNRAFDAVDTMPSSDVVEVVRCKDCKHFISEICRDDFALNFCCGDDYCCYGERKE